MDILSIFYLHPYTLTDSKDGAKGFNEDPLVKLMKRIIRVNFDKERRLQSARQLKDYLLGLDTKNFKV